MCRPITVCGYLVDSNEHKHPRSKRNLSAFCDGTIINAPVIISSPSNDTLFVDVPSHLSHPGFSYLGLVASHFGFDAWCSLEAERRGVVWSYDCKDKLGDMNFRGSRNIQVASVQARKYRKNTNDEVPHTNDAHNRRGPSSDVTLQCCICCIGELCTDWGNKQLQIASKANGKGQSGSVAMMQSTQTNSARVVNVLTLSTNITISLF